MREALPAQMSAFLNFCRIEKGLAANSIQAYSTDLSSFYSFLNDPAGAAGDYASTESLRAWIDHLYQTGLSPRSVARRMTTLRNFFAFLLREGVITQDPTEHLRSPRQWQTIPKFLNLRDIEKILNA